MRNVMSDAHPHESSPEERHVRLAVNAVATVCSFLLDSYKATVRQCNLQSREMAT
jgi:hypothetical protein